MITLTPMGHKNPSRPSILQTAATRIAPRPNAERTPPGASSRARDGILRVGSGRVKRAGYPHKRGAAECQAAAHERAEQQLEPENLDRIRGVGASRAVAAVKADRLLRS